MHLSLRSRLILMTFLVAAVAVVTVGLLARHLTLIEFNRFIVTKRDEGKPATGLSTSELMERYRERGGWAGAQEVIERMGAAAGRRLILADPAGSVLAASPRELLQSKIEISPNHDIKWEAIVSNGDRRYRQAYELSMVPHDILTDGAGKAIATLYYLPSPSDGIDRDEELFIVGLNRTLLIAGLASSAVALIIALLLSRRMLGPIEALTGAARLMGKGDLGQRVRVTTRDEIGELGHAFNAMAESLSRAERLRRNMVSDVAHELRTPLANIRCHLEALQDGLTEPTREFINSLHDEAMLLNRLVEDLQDLALAEAGQLRIESQCVSVKTEVEKAVAALRPQLKEAGLAVNIDVPEAIEAYADPKRLGQVLGNLLSNATTHTTAGGSIKVVARRLEFGIQISVEDTGRGIAPEAVPFIFERFYRVDAARERRMGGAGLGLAIVKQIIEAHGGRVWAESEVSRGTTIFFTLPTCERSGAPRATSQLLQPS